MAEETEISWCDHTFNGWTGCLKISPACENCYAWLGSLRLLGNIGIWGTEKTGTRVVTGESNWKLPLKWDRKAREAGERRRVFAFSYGDVFEKWAGPMITTKGNPLWWCHGSLSNSPLPPAGLPEGCRLATMDDIRDRLLQLIEDTPNLNWMLLTKRPVYALEYLTSHYKGRDPLRNLWLGVTAETQHFADYRIPVLLQAPAVVRFVSAEPLLRPIVFRREWTAAPNRLDLVILGGESHRGHRRSELDWFQSAIEQIQGTGVAVWMKQTGEALARDLGLEARKGDEMTEWPASLCVQEMPR